MTTLDWYGCATFRLRTAGLTVFLDAYIDRVAGGETVDLGCGVRLSVYPSQHSCVWSQGQMAQADQVCIGDLGVTLQEQQRRFGELVAHLTNLGRATLDHLVASNQGARGDGGALLYLFETPEGSILYQDTSGHWTGSFATCGRTWRSWLPRGVGTSTASPSRGAWRSSSPDRSTSFARAE